MLLCWLHESTKGSSHLQRWRWISCVANPTQNARFGNVKITFAIHVSSRAADKTNSTHRRYVNQPFASVQQFKQCSSSQLIVVYDYSISYIINGCNVDSLPLSFRSVGGEPWLIVSCVCTFDIELLRVKQVDWCLIHSLVYCRNCKIGPFWSTWWFCNKGDNLHLEI